MEDRSASDFLRNIRVNRRRSGYTKEQARALYEEHRESVMNELKIREVQRRVTNKILHREDRDVGPVFFRREHDSSMDGVSGLLSGGFEDDESSEAEYGPSCSAASHASGHVSEEISLEEEKRVGKRRTGNRGVGRFLDVEADESGDGDYEGCSDDGGGEYLNDPDFIALSSEEYDEPIRKHREDLLRMDRNVLRRLKRRFSRRPRTRGFFSIDAVDSPDRMSGDEHVVSDDSSDESGTEAMDMDEGPMFSPREDLEYAADARMQPTVSEQVEFSCSVKVAERRLCEEKKGWTFDETEKKDRHQ